LEAIQELIASDVYEREVKRSNAGYKSVNTRKSSFLRGKKISKEGMLPIQGLALERNESARSDPQHKGSL